MADVELVIKQLKESKLYAECNKCGGEFRFSDANVILFDGSKPFPLKAQGIQKSLEQQLQELEDDLKKKKKLASTGAENTSKAVNIGKKLEVICPTLKDFKWTLPDCRFLGDPVDFLAFNGVSVGRVSSISFIEVKSGQSRLNAHQKSIKDAVQDKKVTYKVLE